jgi:hypothetical protein
LALQKTYDFFNKDGLSSKNNHFFFQKAKLCAFQSPAPRLFHISLNAFGAACAEGVGAM